MILSPDDLIRRYTEQGWWRNETITDLFFKNLSCSPDQLALVDPPNRADLAPGAPMRLTYAELSWAFNRLAEVLVKAGVGKDDVVMVQLPNIAEFIITYLAAAQIGAIISPLPVQYRTHELKLVIDLTQPKAFITTTNFEGFNHLEMVQELQPDFPTLQTLIALGDDLPDGVLSMHEILETPMDGKTLKVYLDEVEITANDVFTICWTSGTEANPKGVPRSHNLWVSIAYFTVDGAELDPGCNLLNPFPMVNMSGIGGMLVPWLITGGKLAMHHPLNLPVFLSQIAAEQINYTVVPPVLLDLLLLRPALLENADLSSIKNIGSGSAPLSPSMVGKWKALHNIDVLNFFGANEGTALVSSATDIPDPEERALYFPRFGIEGFEWSQRMAGGIQTRLRDPISGEEITEPGIPGELMIKGATIFHGYYKRPDLTEKAFDYDGYFHTGDLFSLEQGDDGQLSRYRFVGRLKDVIIRGGMTISSEEIEVLINAHPKVQEVAVVGYVDGRKLKEEIITAVVVPAPEEEVSLTEIVEHLREKDIAAYKMPKQMKVIERLPRNPVGKVLKRDLREMLKEESASK